MKFVPASIVSRICAFALDTVVIMAIEICLFFCMLPIIAMGNETWAFVAFMIIYIFVILFYIPICETFFHGKTLGKKCLGIRVVRTDGSRATGINCLQRYLVLPFDTTLTIGMGGLISAMISDKRQRLGDIAANTMVIRDRPQTRAMSEIIRHSRYEFNDYERQQFKEINPYSIVTKKESPLTTAEKYRGVEAKIAEMRTRHAHPRLLTLLEHIQADMHVHMFQRTTISIGDYIKTALRSIPRAVYESRWCIAVAFAVSIAAYLIGVYSQSTDPDFFRQFMGEGYYQTTVSNIESGNPMGIYGSETEWEMFGSIFLNNFLVSLKMYATGLIVLIGPIFFLLNNLAMLGIFQTFFVQQGFWLDGFIVPFEHGTLEIISIIITGGAALRLSTGWLFPGKLSRLRALVHGARQSLLVFVSTIPMLLMAAIIESFITRHTEWPLWIKLTIIIFSLLVLIGYYATLPYLSRRD